MISGNESILYINQSIFFSDRLLCEDFLKFVYRMEGKMVEVTEIEAKLGACDPVFFECIPLTLEEIFISETEVAGYDVKKLVF